ncbi:MAG: hypothetical protein IKP98_00200 [Bacilli bacterium]|nr:hypothetical protein [Bacilli bacterium]
MDQNNKDNIINKNFPKEISEKVIAMIDIPEIREGLKKEGRFEKKYGPFAAGQEAMCALYILSDDKTRETGESSNAKLITNNDGTCYIDFVISTKKTSLTDKEKEEIASHNKMWFGKGEEKPAVITSSSSEIVLSEAELQHMARISSKLNGEDPDKLSPEAKEKYIERLREMMKPMGTSSTWPPLVSGTNVVAEPKLSDNTRKIVENATKTKGFVEYEDPLVSGSDTPGYGMITSPLMVPYEALYASPDDKTVSLSDIDPEKAKEIEKLIELDSRAGNASNQDRDVIITGSTETGVINETTGEYSDYSNTQPANDNNVTPTPSDYFDDTNPRRGGK